MIFIANGIIQLSGFSDRILVFTIKLLHIDVCQFVDYVAAYHGATLFVSYDFHAIIKLLRN